MAEQFSLPQEQVLEELNGEGLGWVLPWGPSHSLIHVLEEVGIGPSQGGGGRVGRPGAALQTALCSPDIGSSIGTAIHSQLKSTVYEALASVLSLGQGECLRGARPHPRPALPFLLLAHPCLSALSAHSWLHVPWGRFHYNYRDQGPAGPLGWGRGKWWTSPKASEDAGSSRGPSVCLWVSQPCRSPWTTSEA